MIDANLVARSHFTRKVDGKTSFETFKRTLGLSDYNLPYEYDSQSMYNQLVSHFVIESWGGYSNASGQWIVFMSWRCQKSKVTQYIHWDWNEDIKQCENRRDYSFQN
jgi:hypothetical protein